MAVIAKTVIRKGEALVLQILSTGVYTDFTADPDAFVITFPDLSILTIKSTFFIDPYYIRIDEIATKLTAYYATNLLVDMVKWGYDTDIADKFLHLSVDDIKLAANAAKFTYTDADGVALAFDYVTFPDGVYKIVTNGDTNPGAVAVNYTCRLLTTKVSDEYLSTSITAYLELKADETAYKQDVDILKDSVLKLMIIQYGIRYDFDYGYFSNANEKAIALKSIVDTGIYIFKPGH
jgi:hypothetical protein